MANMLLEILLILIYVCSSKSRRFNRYGISDSATLPNKTLGFYCLIADDTVAGYGSTANWQPQLYDFQMNGTNVIWLTFVNPQLMPAVPPAMANLATCKGKPGCPPITTRVIFSVGGVAYSNRAWPWLTSQSAAESMAAEVAQWDTKYGADGIDLDIEGGAGSQIAGNNLVAFAKKLRVLNPKMIITQPVYGYPQIAAENTMVNQGFTKNGQSLGLIDSVGIMVYQDLASLNYVGDYTNPWQGEAITVKVPNGTIIAGIQGSASSNVIMQMANDIKTQGLGGMMVWLSSVFDSTNNKAAFTYAHGSGDATYSKSTTGNTWAKAKAAM